MAAHLGGDRCLGRLCLQSKGSPDGKRNKNDRKNKEQDDTSPKGSTRGL